MPDSQPVAWRSVVYGTPVLSSDGEKVGEVREVLGSDADDIFHGLRVTLHAGHRDVMLSSDDVTSLTTTEVTSGLSRTDLEALPAYDEAASYHVASVGTFRKHLGWKKDSESDEEPG
jgi:uncharacterized protein YrrD